MNSDSIPTGPSEVVVNGTITRDILMLSAVTDLVITNLAFVYPATPANAAVVTGLTLGAGQNLFRVSSLTFTGTASVIYSL